ncbi:MAG: molybdopterin-synthase adenylyltransferase MoeB [Candidatus Dadabacteria bacterium]|nr:MAG: molybdopterin-synthase adenylyltransferase MoeB [Candidatus Dadabacteria bacterium]
MATGKDQLLNRLREEVPQVDIRDVSERLERGEKLYLVDVREADEHAQGYIPGAIFIPRTYLEMRIENEIPDKDAEVVVYCASGQRSLFAARALRDLGYTNVVNMAAGFNGWKNAGLPFDMKKGDSRARSARYSRHLLIPEIGEAGQEKLLASRVLMIGAGALGAPNAIYLAAAGVGTIGIVDADVVDESNLQRQVIHRTVDVGRPKVDSAREFIRNLNPDVNVETFPVRLSAENAYEILDHGWDAVINGCDNFPTRYLINDACYFRGIPVVDASIFRFEGQASVYKFGEGPCYRCLYPEPPPPELAPSCAEAGVLGVLPGTVGTIQALETIKLLLGVGENLVGRLLHFDALEMKFRTLHVEKDPACPLCGEQPTVTDLIDYEWFCSADFNAAPAG